MIEIEEESEFRVTEWKDYIGQEALKERLDIHIMSAIQRLETSMDNVFLHGPPGCGKTTLAGVIAHRFNKPFIKYVMPINEKVLRAIILAHRGVVLFDELHRCSKAQQEQLLTLVEDAYFITKTGQVIENHDLTIIGATTERAEIIKPLFDRFAVRPDFVPYTEDEMTKIARGMIKRSGIDFGKDFPSRFGAAAAGIPRNVQQMVVMARDLTVVNGKTTVEEVLDRCHLTDDGLTTQHVAYMDILGQNHEPMGVKMLSTHLQLGEASVLEIEKLLKERGWMSYTRSGRELTAEGHKRIQEIRSTP